LQDLKEIFAKIRPAPLPGLPRFWGGAVGYWDYDTVRYFERLPDGRPDPLKLPTGAFQLSGEVVVFDRFSQSAQIISNIQIPAGKKSPKSLKQLYQKGARAIKAQIKRIQGPLPAAKRRRTPVLRAPKPLMTQQAFESAVERAKEHIRAGDIIQVVLSQR